MGQQDLITLALGRPLVARLGVLDDENYGERQCSHQGSGRWFPTARETGSDADGDPYCDRDDDEHRGQQPRRMPVHPRQPPADMRTLCGWT